MNYQRLRFYFYRLRRSSLAELAGRMKEGVFLSRLRRNPHSYKAFMPKSLPFQESLSTLRFPQLSGKITPDTDDWLLAGKVFCLNQDIECIHLCERKWRNTFFSNVRLGGEEPDIRAVWEPARLQHLVLLLHYLEKGDNAAESGAVVQYVRIKLLEWLDENPFPYGPHYISVMECGLRIPVFLRALQANIFKTEEYEKVCVAIFQHGWLIRNRLSLYTSLGNHTITECVGLVMAGAAFKEHDVCREWLKTGIQLLEQECRHQILDDGGPAEQSFAYHRFVLDLYWLAIGFLMKNGLHDCLAMRERVVLGEGFLSAMQQNDESMICVGDSDDGYAVAPGLAPEKDVDLKFPAHDVAVFPDSGYTVLRNEAGVRILFDHGRLGMEPLNNHGHADALSVFLSIKDVDFMVDPGTFQYNGDQELRRYFKGTRAHNTVCIGGRDQAKQLTSFVWERSFDCVGRYEKKEDGVHQVSGWHNGYRQQKVPVTHYRTLSFDPAGDVVIEDRFEGRGEHEYALHFHLHPGVDVARNDGKLILQRGGVVVEMEIDSERIDVLQGQKSPLAGWYSPAYGELFPTTTIRVVKHGLPCGIGFKTHLIIHNTREAE